MFILFIGVYLFVGKVKAVEVDNDNGFIYFLQHNRIERRTFNDSHIQTTHKPTEGKLKLVLLVSGPTPNKALFKELVAPPWGL